MGESAQDAPDFVFVVALDLLAEVVRLCAVVFPEEDEIEAAVVERD
jgi:hypothetical protein